MIEDVLNRIAKALEGIEARLHRPESTPNSIPVVTEESLKVVPEKKPRGKKESIDHARQVIRDDMSEESFLEEAVETVYTKDDAKKELIAFIGKSGKPKALELIRKIKEGATHIDHLDDVPGAWTKLVELCRD